MKSNKTYGMKKEEFFTSQLNVINIRSHKYREDYKTQKNNSFPTVSNVTVCKFLKTSKLIVFSLNLIFISFTRGKIQRLDILYINFNYVSFKYRDINVQKNNPRIYQFTSLK